MKAINRLFYSSIVLIHALATLKGTAEESSGHGPQLQILNGSAETGDIYWLKSATERVANGSVEPGKDKIISTSLGHRFEIVGRDEKVSLTFACEVPVQAVRFDPKGRDGVPAFYTQSVSAHGFPIVASAKVNPYALHGGFLQINKSLIFSF